MGLKRALRGASMGGWISAADERFRRESIEMRAVGGGEGGVDIDICSPKSSTIPSSRPEERPWRWVGAED